MSSPPAPPRCPADGAALEEYSPGAYRCSCDGRWLARGHIYDDVHRLLDADLPRETEPVACPGCGRIMGILRLGLLGLWVNWCDGCRSIRQKPRFLANRPRHEPEPRQ